jgi:CheY-like chemotaxis protein
MALRAKLILIVEDAPDSREAFAHLLRSEGAEVVTTGTGREALDQVAHTPFEVVLTDLGLPDIPGEILIREVLAFTSPRPRIVVMTGYGEPYLTRARAAGADAVLTKPLEWSSLLRELEPPVEPLAA